jgi:hypothetical protein
MAYDGGTVLAMVVQGAMVVHQLPYSAWALFVDVVASVLASASSGEVMVLSYGGSGCPSWCAYFLGQDLVASTFHG